MNLPTGIIKLYCTVPVNMLDLIQKHFGSSLLWPLWLISSRNWAGFCMPDPTSHTRFSSVLPKKAQIIVCEMAWIWSGWPGQVLAKCIWSRCKQVWQNHWAPLLAECNQPATSLPLSHLLAFFHRQPGSYCAKPAWVQPGSGWLSGLGQTDPVWKQASVQESLGLLLANTSKLIQIGSGMFTGIYWTDLKILNRSETERGPERSRRINTQGS